MDYKEQAELNKALAEEWNKASCIAKIGGMKPEEFLVLNSAAITDLLARAEAAEVRAEKAERERDEFKEKYIESVNRACELSKIVDEHGLEE